MDMTFAERSEFLDRQDRLKRAIAKRQAQRRYDRDVAVATLAGSLGLLLGATYLLTQLV